MLTYAEALKTVLNHIQPLGIEQKDLLKAQGQVLAEDVYSDYDLPLADTSGPDGYAVIAEDIKNAGKEKPVTLNIIGTVKAGSIPRSQVIPGTAVRIMTGSVMPGGADCVVRFEDTDEPGDKNGPNAANPVKVKIYVSVPSGANVRKAGFQIRKGTQVLARGALIGPTQISALAAVGKVSIKVFRKPIVAVITTGDELIKFGESLSPGKSYDCNALAISALVTHYGGIPLILGIARDNEASIRSRMQKGIPADAIVTSGGVSRGDYDLVRLTMEKVGKVVFSRIKMGPGASFAFGLANLPSSEGEPFSKPIFALSGPPNGCIINFETLVRPAFLKMRGLTSLNHPAVEAVAEDSSPGKKPMAFVKWTNLKSTAAGYQVRLNSDEGLLSSMASANSLTIMPEGSEIKNGDKIEVLPLDWFLS